MSRRQLETIAYLQEENRILKQRLGSRRLRFTDAERSRLARKAHALGYKLLHTLETLVTPETLMRWYRQLIARKWDSSDQRRTGRPRTRQALVDLILRLARENPSWDIRASRARSPIYITRWDEARSPRFLRSTAWSRRLSAASAPLGRLS